ncbi:hypothetical protein Q4Q34_09025 [Flavivirga abyssicola]|uniref:hypothetical protein n=1 Tax=Flavivirga abyssicola TaxID=3063533 RepID=UPI0026E01B0D|nr:hypothetical protein [Flavivirga sp. MEBiC07777]WVK15169.1 hypothetical protein Q4Q34_09025 [Flavivirga sp. MEBiC07777]
MAIYSEFFKGQFKLRDFLFGVILGAGLLKAFWCFSIPYDNCDYCDNPDPIKQEECLKACEERQSCL